VQADWTFKDLNYWDEKICEIATDYGLSWFPISYEICDYYEMIGHMSYGGMPSHYQHWSYGKAFERSHQFYNLGLEGLPYELIINSNPSIAYLMRENPLYLQILIMAHCVGHSDFFKNNRLFEKTRPEFVVSSFRTRKERIRGYVEDPHIGIDKVESLLDSIHSIRYQVERYGRERISHKALKLEAIEMINKSRESSDIDINKVPIKEDSDILGFFVEHGHHLEEWEKDIIEICREESLYFVPQIRTKIVNEGWASFWHYKIMHDLDLPQKYHIPFIKTHNQVIRPHIGSINPYHLGFHMFQKIEKEKGLEACFEIREIHHDESAIRCFFDREDFEKLNIFSYSDRKDRVVVDDVSDIEGFDNVKRDLIKNTGINTIPHIYVDEMRSDGSLVVKHHHDGRDLELSYASKVIDHIAHIWKKPITFLTVIEDEIWEI
tara:strand:+ start:5792 stop:7096 length:1305 start_codon:yes stop_codon:yes gene_type:complete